MHFLILLFLAYNCLIFPNLNIWAFVSIWCEPSTTESQQTKMHLLHLAVSLMPNMTKFSSHFSLFRGNSGTLIQVKTARVSRTAVLYLTFMARIGLVHFIAYFNMSDQEFILGFTLFS